MTVLVEPRWWWCLIRVVEEQWWIIMGVFLFDVMRCGESIGEKIDMVTVHEV